MMEEVQKHSVHTLVFRSLKRTHDMFLSDQANIPATDKQSLEMKMKCKAKDEYGAVMHIPKQQQHLQPRHPENLMLTAPYGSDENQQWSETNTSIAGTFNYPSAPGVVLANGSAQNTAPPPGMHIAHPDQTSRVGASVKDIQQNAGALERYAPPSRIASDKMKTALTQRKAPTMPKPSWHPPWKLYRVISGHQGWVRCAAFEPGNEWFATGSADRVIKIWDLASGTLKLSLTGHVSTVRGLVVSPRHPFLFSCGEDKQVKCWDLEYNKVIRHYHGHLSACYSIDIHPTIDVLVTCGRDATARVWDMRTKACIHTLTGHQNTVAQVKCQAAEPQIITGSHDSTIRLWDLVAGRSKVTLTNHKKSVRALALHPTQYTFASASPDNIKQWKFPDGNFLQNLTGHNSILNGLALNSDNVLVSGADNGGLYFWDWKSGYNFQRMTTSAQPGSIDSESGIFSCTFDNSGSRLVTCEADKTIKIYKEDDTATEETHPIHWKPEILRKKRY
ncbi:pleiotropic regulator 1-like [Tubulanus polymorphus]|uniref:pleiotropic regulator 1-like n=1 Tax=Tubulanus polymorphus TaxID=672921 RepID=UPI003DA65B72